MKTTTKPNQKYFKLSLLTLGVLFVFGLTGFNSESDNFTNAPLMPGVVFEIEVKDHAQSPPKVESIETAVEGENIKMEILPDEEQGKGKMIFRGDRGKNGEVVLVDDDKKEYYIMDDAFVDAMMKRVDESKNMMNEAMKHLTKEQRDMIEKMKKEKGANVPGFGMAAVPQMKLVNTGKKGTKAGYPCVKYEVYLDGKKIREIWTTDWSNINGGDEAAKAFKGMYNFFGKIKDKMGDFPGANNFYDEMNFDKGFPVVSKGFNEDTGSLEDESTLRSTKRRTIDPADFEPPSGYKRRSMGPH